MESEEIPPLMNNIVCLHCDGVSVIGTPGHSSCCPLNSMKCLKCSFDRRDQYHLKHCEGKDYDKVVQDWSREQKQARAKPPKIFPNNNKWVLVGAIIFLLLAFWAFS